MNKKDITVHLNFDDFHPQFDEFGDFGGLGGSNLEKILNLLEEFPKLKITMFTVPNWIDRPYRIHRYWYFVKEFFKIMPVVKPAHSEPYLLRKHPEWCSLVRNLVEKGRIEIAVHGYFHFNSLSRIHGQEFFRLDEKTTLQRILLAEEEFVYNNIPFVKAFRTPGWGRNKYIPKTLKKLDYLIDARYSSNSKTSHFEKDSEGLLILPQNWSIKEKPEEALRIAEKYGSVFMKGHIAYKYGEEIVENGITEEYWSNLRSALKHLEELYNVEYTNLQTIITHQM